MNVRVTVSILVQATDEFVAAGLSEPMARTLASEVGLTGVQDLREMPWRVLEDRLQATPGVAGVTIAKVRAVRDELLGSGSL